MRFRSHRLASESIKNPANRTELIQEQNVQSEAAVRALLRPRPSALFTGTCNGLHDLIGVLSRVRIFLLIFSRLSFSRSLASCRFLFLF